MKGNKHDHKICSRDEERLLLDEKDVKPIWRLPRRQIPPANPNSRAKTPERDSIIERRVYLISPENNIVNHNVPSDRIVRPEMPEYADVRHEKRSQGGTTTSTDSLCNNLEATRYIQKRKYREEGTEDSMQNNSVEQGRQRQVKDKRSSVEYKNRKERDFPNLTRPHILSSTTNLRCPRNPQKGPVTGANAIQLPSSQPRRHIPVRTPQQTNRILLQLAGYIKDDRN